MVVMVSRSGRHLQRYNKQGRRLVVGCIPYRYKTGDDQVEVLVISSQRQGKGMLFPKGGWEADESIKDAAERESFEEAGVTGIVQRKLGKWTFKSKRHETDYEGYMFPLLVKQQLDLWPEIEFRQRIWMSISEARQACQHVWMQEALDKLERRLETRPKTDDRDLNISRVGQICI
ncbi:nudix hydrolase 21, chloroplastic-like [Impatiens glandulifera]|uniref:nudix hydrolase 21, chloroplastic-like n=1 Tax=Impatiens glandulifera TaxID=253017 RepID=UPI001FB109CA|nr:nudix hydrolase 21, chloroplastic-like [Impatiens glandulifera]